MRLSAGAARESYRAAPLVLGGRADWFSEPRGSCFPIASTVLVWTPPQSRSQGLGCISFTGEEDLKRGDREGGKAKKEGANKWVALQRTGLSPPRDCRTCLKVSQLGVWEAGISYTNSKPHGLGSLAKQLRSAWGLLLPGVTQRPLGDLWGW